MKKVMFVVSIICLIITSSVVSSIKIDTDQNQKLILNRKSTDQKIPFDESFIKGSPERQIVSSDGTIMINFYNSTPGYQYSFSITNLGEEEIQFKGYFEIYKKRNGKILEPRDVFKIGNEEGSTEIIRLGQYQSYGTIKLYGPEYELRGFCKIVFHLNFWGVEESEGLFDFDIEQEAILSGNQINFLDENSKSICKASLILDLLDIDFLKSLIIGRFINKTLF